MLWKIISGLKRQKIIFHTRFMRWLGVCMEPSSEIHPFFDTNRPQRIFLGKKVVLYKNITMYCGNGKIEIGAFSHCAPFCYFLCNQGTIKIGEKVAVGPYSCFFTYSNSYDPLDRSKDFVDCKLEADVVVGNNVFIGARSVILPGTVIEDNVIVAAGSVVKGRLPEGFIYGGSPAKQIKRIWKE